MLNPMMNCFLLFIVSYASLVAFTAAELYSAMAGLEQLLDTQKAIVSALESFTQEFTTKIKELQKLKKEYESLFNASSTRFQDFISNPVNAFVLMKRLSMDWNETRTKLWHFTSNETEHLNVVYPDNEDISGAAKALLRVQQTYTLDTAALSDGVLPGAPKGLELTADDCYEMGRQAFRAGYFDYAISWMAEARYKFVEKKQEIRENPEVAKYLDMFLFDKGKDSIAFLTNSILQLGYMMSPFMAEGNLSDDFSLERVESNARFTSQMNAFDEAIYRKLCQSKKEDTTLTFAPQIKCRLFNRHPYLKLQPVKEEELWEKPRISVYHDIVSDSQIEVLKSLALPMLERAEVAEYTGHLGHRVSDTRVTKIAWVNKGDHPLISRLYRRIEQITGLSSLTAEPFQMANYGLGGHFHLHMDVLPDTEKYYGPDMGNRIATWLIYMSDVNHGGATVFPRLNLTVWPRKGSALFWHNVKSNGIGDILTLHGACPVVTGSKWVTNVWFHERDQEFRLKCGRHPESSMLPTGWNK